MKSGIELRRTLPMIGIVAFSLCSVWSLYHLLSINSIHSTPLFWGAAILVELVTAWAVYQVVESMRQVTKSNISKQDRRFYGIIMSLFLLVSIPTLAASVVANTIEFGGNILLGLLFPVASVGCAVGTALPETVKVHEKKRQREATEEAAKKKRREKEKQAKAKQAEIERQEQERRRLEEEKHLQELEKQRQEMGRRLAMLGKAAETLKQLAENPMQSQAAIAAKIGLTRQAVGQHFTKLEEIGAINRGDGEGIVVVWEMLEKGETE